LYDDHYEALRWLDESERWRQAKSEGTIDDEIAALGDAKLKRLRKTWSAAYKPEELLWLDNFYN
jgi:hypothetical protein